MAYETDSVNKRSLGAGVGSAVVGLAIGVVSVIGIAQFSGDNAVPQSAAVPADQALLGSPEYGTR